MAVPKSKTSRKKRGQRRAQNSSGKWQPVSHLREDPTTGELGRSHHITEGYYNNREVLIEKVKPEDEDILEDESQES